MSNYYFKDLTGLCFGRLTVLESSNERKHGKIVWKCKCTCGSVIMVPSNYLTSGDTKSCGCLKKELTQKRNILLSKHNSSNTRLYRVWSSMKTRCYYPRDKYYGRYGGRGISICDEWKDNFIAFRDWALANGYDENAPRGACTLDRINNDLGYSPENCRWVDMKVQSNNRHKKSKS